MAEDPESPARRSGSAEAPGPADAADRRTRLLLGLGAAAGLALATASVIGEAPDARELPPGVVARVGDALIRADDYERLVAGLESDRREPVDAELRRHVLDRMIDEELLVQRAVALGLVEVDRRVRANLTSAMIAAIVDDAEDTEPGEDELRTFLRENAGFFTSPGRLHVQQIFFRVRDAGRGPGEARAAEAARRLAAGEDWQALRAELGDEEIAPLPDAPLPAQKLREYVGPTALRAAMELEPGAISAPIRSGTGFHILRLVGREPARTPAYEEIADQVRAEWRRRQGDRALRAYLDALREDTLVVTAPGAADAG